MKKTGLYILILVLAVCALLAGCGARTGESAPETEAQENAEAGGNEANAIDPQAAAAYLAVVDEFAERLGYEEAEASEGECLVSGFLHDWDGDGTPELCLLLKTSPREDGTPLYGWYAPTLRLYTIQDGQAVFAGEDDLYFATAGRETDAAAIVTEGRK